MTKHVSKEIVITCNVKVHGVEPFHKVELTNYMIIEGSCESEILVIAMYDDVST